MLLSAETFPSGKGILKAQNNLLFSLKNTACVAERHEANRMYNCKDENCRLSVILLYAVDFAGHSPEFNALFIQGFAQEIVAASALVSPVFETAELKHVTRHLYATVDGLIDSANRRKGYIELANGAIPFSEKNFELTAPRHKIRGRDAEGVLTALRVVHENIVNTARL